MTTPSHHFSFSLSQLHPSFLSLCRPLLLDQVREQRGGMRLAVSLEREAAP